MFLFIEVSNDTKKELFVFVLLQPFNDLMKQNKNDIISGCKTRVTN